MASQHRRAGRPKSATGLLATFCLCLPPRPLSLAACGRKCVCLTLSPLALTLGQPGRQVASRRRSASRRVASRHGQAGRPKSATSLPATLCLCLPPRPLSLATCGRKCVCLNLSPIALTLGQSGRGWRRVAAVREVLRRDATDGPAGRSPRPAFFAKFFLFMTSRPLSLATCGRKCVRLTLSPLALILGQPGRHVATRRPSASRRLVSRHGQAGRPKSATGLLATFCLCLPPRPLSLATCGRKCVRLTSSPPALNLGQPGRQVAMRRRGASRHGRAGRAKTATGRFATFCLCMTPRPPSLATCGRKCVCHILSPHALTLGQPGRQVATRRRGASRRMARRHRRAGRPKPATGLVATLCLYLPPRPPSLKAFGRKCVCFTLSPLALVLCQTSCQVATCRRGASRRVASQH